MSKIVIVGSGPGLANAVARRFGQEGWQVVMMARNAERLEAEANTFADQGIDARPVVCDVSDLERLDSQIRAESADGGIDLLSYNAAVIRPDVSIFDTPIDTIRSDITIDLTAALVAVRAAIPGMAGAGRGTILFSGGILAIDPMPNFLTLGVGKAGLKNCAAALAKDPACEKLRIGYINIHAWITPENSGEIADLYYTIHTRPAERHQLEVTFERPFDWPGSVQS